VRIMVDTNIFVSGIISKKGTPAKIIEAILEGILVPVMSEATFAELQEVLHRPRLQIYFQRAGITPEFFYHNFTVTSIKIMGGTENKLILKY